LPSRTRKSLRKLRLETSRFETIRRLLALAFLFPRFSAEIAETSRAVTARIEARAELIEGTRDFSFSPTWPFSNMDRWRDFLKAQKRYRTIVGASMGGAPRVFSAPRTFDLGSG
jgi:hypothetical protein